MSCSEICTMLHTEGAVILRLRPFSTFFEVRKRSKKVERNVEKSRKEEREMQIVEFTMDNMLTVTGTATTYDNMPPLYWGSQP